MIIQKKLWEYINEALYNRDTRAKCSILPEMVCWNNGNTSDKVDICNALNYQFISSASTSTAANLNLALDINENVDLNSLFIKNKFDFQNVDSNDVLHSIKKLKNGSAAGLDQINNKLIKTLSWAGLGWVIFSNGLGLGG